MTPRMRNLTPLLHQVVHRDLPPTQQPLVDTVRDVAEPTETILLLLLLFLLRSVETVDGALDASRATTRKPDTVPLLRQFA